MDSRERLIQRSLGWIAEATPKQIDDALQAGELDSALGAKRPTLDDMIRRRIHEQAANPMTSRTSPISEISDDMIRQRAGAFALDAENQRRNLDEANRMLNDRSTDPLTIDDLIRAVKGRSAHTDNGDTR